MISNGEKGSLPAKPPAGPAGRARTEAGPGGQAGAKQQAASRKAARQAGRRRQAGGQAGGRQETEVARETSSKQQAAAEGDLGQFLRLGKNPLCWHIFGEKLIYCGKLRNVSGKAAKTNILRAHLHNPLSVEQQFPKKSYCWDYVSNIMSSPITICTFFFYNGCILTKM